MPGLWCRTCDLPVTRQDSQPVHEATGLAEGPDGHRASPSATDPAMKGEARKIAEEFGGRWQIDALLGFFYAVPTGVKSTPVHVEASTGDELRWNLAAQETIWKLARR
jgi:hypothetical protein